MPVAALTVSLLVTLLLAACGDAGPRDVDALRRDVVSAGAIYFGDPDLPPPFDQYVARECLAGQDLQRRLLVYGYLQDAIGGADARIEVTDVEFTADDRAYVTLSFVLDGEPTNVFGGDAPEAALWVRQDGRWRSAEDCDFYEAG